jgi:uncharacterized cupin superfamily protein
MTFAICRRRASYVGRNLGRQEGTRRSSTGITIITNSSMSGGNPTHTTNKQGGVATTKSRTAPIAAFEVPSITTSVYPKKFQEAVHGRIKRKLGNVFDLTNFGVNLTILEPGASSALQHLHSKQDEFVYILRGTATLRLGTNEFCMSAGDCVGFRAGNGIGHCIINQSSIESVEFLEIGDRTLDDEVTYPEVDLKANEVNGQWVFTRKTTGETYNE